MRSSRLWSAAILVAVLFSSVVHTPAEPIATDRISVVDGDTIRVAGMPKSVRLVGYNAPETHDARCAFEAALGAAAAERVTQLLVTGQADFTLVACACRPGTEGTDNCNYGRACGVLSVDGREVGATLISEGLAVPFVCGATRCPPTPRPWCN